MGVFNSIFGRRSDTPPPPDAEDAVPVAKIQTPSPPRVAPQPSQVDFTAIFEAAGVSAEDRKRVIKAQDLLRSLPADTPAQIKRDIVEAAFKAFDVPTSKIVIAASNEIEALNAFIQKSEDETKRIQAEGSKQIAALEAKIAEVKVAMADAMAEQENRVDAAAEEILRVQPVLHFFVREQDDDRDSVDVQVDAGKDEG